MHPENADVMSISQFMAQNLRQPPPPIPPPPKHTFEISEGESVEIEKIVAAEKKDGQLYYKVKWVKYTWEAEESIQHLPHLIDGYWREHFYQNINQAAIDTTGISLVSNENDYARNKSVVVNPHDNREVQKHVGGNIVTTPAENQDVNNPNVTTPTVTEGNDVILEFTMGQQGKPMETFQNRVQLNVEKKARRAYPLERKYLCNVCNKAFDRNTSLTRHMLVHTREKPFKCQLCDKAFSQNAHLKRHILIHIGQKSYQCNKCGKMFIEKGGLARHEATHSTDKPWVCNQCGKSFVLNEYLQRHLFLHTGQKPYQCNECGRLFADGSSWRAHKLTHNKEKKYKCHICSKMLKCKRNFKKHVQAHEEEKEMKHNCDVCDLRFPNKKLLKDHLRKARKNHRCKVCNKLLRTRDKYVTHMATHDPNSATYNPEVKMADPEEDKEDEKDDGEDGSMKSDDDQKSDGENQEKEEEEEEEEEEEDDDESNDVAREEGEVLLDKILKSNPDAAISSDNPGQVASPTDSCPSTFTTLILKAEHLENACSSTPDTPEISIETPTTVSSTAEAALVAAISGSTGLTLPVGIGSVAPSVDVANSRQNTIAVANNVITNIVVASAQAASMASVPIEMPNTDTLRVSQEQISVAVVPGHESSIGLPVTHEEQSIAVQNDATSVVSSGVNMLPNTATDADVAETIILITQNNDVDMPEQM